MFYIAPWIYKIENLSIYRGYVVNCLNAGSSYSWVSAQFIPAKTLEGSYWDYNRDLEFLHFH